MIQDNKETKVTGDLTPTERRRRKITSAQCLLKWLRKAAKDLTVRCKTREKEDLKAR